MVAFRCYDHHGGRDGWRDALPPEFDHEVDSALELLERHATLKDERYFKELRGKCAGLTEIRIDFEAAPPNRKGVHVRILCTGTANDFVLLYAFCKRGGPDYGPACHAAINRKRGVERDGWRAAPCRFP